MSPVLGAQRAILLTGAALFGAFAVVAFVFRRLDVSQETLSIVAGGFAYVFIVAAAVLILRAWRRQRAHPSVAAERFLTRHPAVRAAVGAPVGVGPSEGDVPAGRGAGAGQANIAVPISGPLGEGRADLVMARLGREWEVLSATLDAGAGRVGLAEGPTEGSATDG